MKYLKYLVFDHDAAQERWNLLLPYVTQIQSESPEKNKIHHSHPFTQGLGGFMDNTG